VTYDPLVIIATLINLVALGGFAYWTRGWFTALKGAVDVQKETIAAQKEQLQGLQSLLNVTDYPEMLKRLAAYKEFVDREKEAAIQELQPNSQRNKLNRQNLYRNVRNFMLA